MVRALIAPAAVGGSDVPLVALFGAAGFAGRAILDALLDAGYCVRALDLTKSSWTQPDAHGRTRFETGLPQHRLAQTQNSHLQQD